MLTAMTEVNGLSVAQFLGQTGVCREDTVERWLENRAEVSQLNAAKEDEKNTIRIYEPIMSKSEVSAAIENDYGIQSASAASVRLQLEEADGGPLNVRIHSPGGMVPEYSAIDTLLSNYAARNDTEINTFADGMVASAAALLFLRGDNRYMAPMATLMYHKIWASPILVRGGSPDEIRKAAKNLLSIADFAEKQNDTLVNYVADRVDMTAEEFNKKIDDQDWYMDFNEAKELGFATALNDVYNKDDSDEEPELNAAATEDFDFQAKALFTLLTQERQ